MVLKTPRGPQEMTGRFQQEGDVVRGVLRSESGEQAFEGTIAGQALQWEIKVGKPMAMTLKYDVEIAGDRISGKVKMGIFGTAKLSGERM